jgi:deazaflavin-dependent oxidoreductase (nitroreductase family)
MTATPIPQTTARQPRLGGLFMSLARATAAWMRPLAGKRWNPVFSVVRHTGRQSGKTFETPVAARRVEGGFVIALAFGSDAHWYRNLVAAEGGVISWRGVDHPVGRPEPIDGETALAAFMSIQRAALRAADIDGYVRVPDVASAAPAPAP